MITHVAVRAACSSSHAQRNAREVFYCCVESHLSVVFDIFNVLQERSYEERRLDNIAANRKFLLGLGISSGHTAPAATNSQPAAPVLPNGKRAAPVSLPMRAKPRMRTRSPATPDVATPFPAPRPPRRARATDDVAFVAGEFMCLRTDDGASIAQAICDVHRQTLVWDVLWYQLEGSTLTPQINPATGTEWVSRSGWRPLLIPMHAQPVATNRTGVFAVDPDIIDMALEADRDVPLTPRVQPAILSADEQRTRFVENLVAVTDAQSLLRECRSTVNVPQGTASMDVNISRSWFRGNEDVDGVSVAMSCTLRVNHRNIR